MNSGGARILMWQNNSGLKKFILDVKIAKCIEKTPQKGF